MSNGKVQSRVQRQVKLPISKAIEIAWKSIRMRLSRSLLVTSGITLALAFLISILVNEAMTKSMRRWSAAAPTSARFADLQKQRAELEQKLRPVENEIRINARKGLAPPDGAAPFDPVKSLGSSWEQIIKELGQVPTPVVDLNKLLVAQPPFIEKLQEWIAGTRKLKQIKDELNGPQTLDAIMKASGIPTTEKDIANNRIQTRWLLGLALMVAFVGILNAMLMSVTERFREIGTMKCLGALDGFIVKLFLIESLFQGVVGTLSGLIIGIALSLLAVTNSFGHFAWIEVPWGELIVACVICLGVGVTLTVAGAVYPAWQAARMEPIAAMRVET